MPGGTLKLKTHDKVFQSTPDREAGRCALRA